MGSAKRGASRTPNPPRILLTVLLIVFSVEVAVMVALPLLLPGDLDERIVAFVDACFLTFVAAPILWWVVIRPLRRLAVTEEAKAESIVAAAADGIVTVDERGNVDSFNPAAEAIFGYTSEEVVGRNVAILIPVELAERHRLAFLEDRATRKSLAAGQPLDVIGLRKDGRQVPLALSVSSHEVGGHCFFTGILRDLTEAKYRASQQAAMVEFGRHALVCDQLDPLLDEAAHCVAQTLHVDFSAVFQLSASGETLRLAHGVGWPSELVGKAVIDAKGEGSPGRALQGTAVTEGDIGKCYDANADFFREHGILAGGAVAIQAAPHPYGVLAAYRKEPRALTDDETHFLRDVAVEITLALQRQQSELQHRKRDQNRADHMATIAQLATGVAHEIRNPLTSVKMLIQIGKRSPSNGLKQSDLDVIESEIRRMERSLKAFLDFARPAEPERKRLELVSLVDRTLALVEARASAQGIRMQRCAPEADVEIWADEDQMQQMLLNLVLNGLDAMPDGGRLWIEIDPTAEDYVELRVLDTGTGVPSELMNRLFQPFVSGKDTGTGLGLVICRRIAEDHGGSLSAENRAEGGACFTLRMPLPNVEPVDPE